MKPLAKTILILAALLAIVPSSAKPPKSATLKSQKQQAEQRAKDAEQRLQANRETMRLNLNELNSIDAESEILSLRIESMTRTADSLRRAIAPLADSIDVMSARLDTMKASYSRAIKKSYRSRTDLDRLSFIFSASSFSQAWKRSRSIRQFADWRRRRASDLIEAKGVLEGQKARLDSLSGANDRLLRAISRDLADLEAKRARISHLISRIESSTADLQREIDLRNSEMARLDGEITKAVAAEEAEAKRAAAKATSTSSTSFSSSSVATPSAPKPSAPKPDLTDITARIDSLKGSLAPPVDGRRVIVKKFGRQRHPRLPKVYTDNAGIDIETDRGTRVKAVYDGEVSQIFKIGGYNNVVVLRHGSYVTVYANLVDLRVSKGDIVAAGEQIGNVYVDAKDNNRSVLHFEIRKEKEKLNPEEWIKL